VRLAIQVEELADVDRPVPRALQPLGQGVALVAQLAVVVSLGMVSGRIVGTA
jgi:hypothetical protein